MANVMLIEERAADTGAMERMLEWHGHHVFVVRDGRSAPAWLNRVCPDLILLDADALSLNPLELLRAIRGNPAQRDVPVLVFATRAAGADEHAIDLALQSGADRFVLTDGPAGIGRVGACIEEHLASPNDQRIDQIPMTNK